MEEEREVWNGEEVWRKNEKFGMRDHMEQQYFKYKRDHKIFDVLWNNT